MKNSDWMDQEGSKSEIFHELRSVIQVRKDLWGVDVESGDGDTDLEVHMENIVGGDDPRSPRVEEVFELLMRDDRLYG